MTRADIALMLRGAQMRNLTLEITGLLLQHHNIFLHYLEGPEASVKDLLCRLSRDPRHKHMGFWFTEPAASRLIPAHPMAFSDGVGPQPLPPVLEAQWTLLLNGRLPDAAELIPSTAGQIEFWRFCTESLQA